jgi:hypothetical protein
VAVRNSRRGALGEWLAAQTITLDAGANASTRPRHEAPGLAGVAGHATPEVVARTGLARPERSRCPRSPPRCALARRGARNAPAVAPSIHVPVANT